MPAPASDPPPASSSSVLVVGAGDATGGAIARRFAREGYAACVVRRNAEHLTRLVAEIQGAGGRARPFGVDARDEARQHRGMDNLADDLSLDAVDAIALAAVE